MVLAEEKTETKTRPEWFWDFWGTALTHFSHTNHEELLETALGVAKMIDNGNQKDAKLLIEQAKKALQQDSASGGKGGEARSNQVVQMIACGNYPPDLTAIAKSVVLQKYPEQRNFFSTN